MLDKFTKALPLRYSVIVLEWSGQGCPACYRCKHVLPAKARCASTKVFLRRAESRQNLQQAEHDKQATKSASQGAVLLQTESQEKDGAAHQAPLQVEPGVREDAARTSIQSGKASKSALLGTVWKKELSRDRRFVLHYTGGHGTCFSITGTAQESQLLAARLLVCSMLKPVPYCQTLLKSKAASSRLLVFVIPSNGAIDYEGFVVCTGSELQGLCKPRASGKVSKVVTKVPAEWKIAPGSLKEHLLALYGNVAAEPEASETPPTAVTPSLDVSIPSPAATATLETLTASAAQAPPPRERTATARAGRVSRKVSLQKGLENTALAPSAAEASQPLQSSDPPQGAKCQVSSSASKEVVEVQSPTAKRDLVLAHVVALLQPMLESKGLKASIASHGQAMASFTISKRGEANASMPCLPIHLRVSCTPQERHSQSRAQFGKLSGLAGLVILVVLPRVQLASNSTAWQSSLSAYLFTGSQLKKPQITLTPGLKTGRYGLHFAGGPQDFARSIADFAAEVCAPVGDESSSGTREGQVVVVQGGGSLPAGDVLPLPYLEDATTPVAESHIKGQEAFDVFLAEDGLLAGPRLQALFQVVRKEGTRGGSFELVCKLGGAAVVLKAHGCLGSLRVADSGVFVGTRRKEGGICQTAVPVGAFDLLAVYTPCLRGVYLIPDHVLAQRGIRSSGKKKGKLSTMLRPYGRGRQKRTLQLNKFLVDCEAPPDLVVARCRALLKLAAEGKVKGWEAMPPVEELRLSPVTLPLPKAFAPPAPGLP